VKHTVNSANYANILLETAATFTQLVVFIQKKSSWTLVTPLSCEFTTKHCDCLSLNITESNFISQVLRSLLFLPTQYSAVIQEDSLSAFLHFCSDCMSKSSL